MAHYLPYYAFFSPLVGFFIAILLNKRVSDRLVQWLSCSFMGIAAVASIFLFIAFKTTTLTFWQWIDVDSLNMTFGMMMDRTSLTMMVMVNVVSALIHIYSVGYMSHDASIPRFMAYLSLFTFFMLSLIMAPNLVQLFLGWEGVGLASYLLIGFWFHKPSANSAAIKAFVVNRVGDAGLVVGLAALFFMTQTLDLQRILEPSTLGLLSGKTFLFFGYSVDAVSLICMALFLGVMGKSAQIGLHVWLPDAMEGPTPVSALIHAATMVTAGVYLLIRLHPLFEMAVSVQHFIAWVGGVTCFFAATVALVQEDIKRVIAYSTCSQLGYMVMAAGMGGVDAAFFHLITHAFFKALLFLGAGAVIHALSDEQNMEKMGGLYRRIPFTYAMMWIGNLALAGIPFFSGFYSKDSILVATYAGGTAQAKMLFGIGLFVAFLTALYSWRLLIKVFHGSPRADEHVMAHIHEAPWVMRVPLICLALGATFLGFMTEDFFIHHHASVPSWVLQAPIIAALLGVGAAYFFFFTKPHVAFNLTRHLKYLYLFALNKWFFDKIYSKIFVQGSLELGTILWQRGDLLTIDRLGPNGLASLVTRISTAFKQLQTGYLYHYAFAMMVGLMSVLLYLWVQGGFY